MCGNNAKPHTCNKNDKQRATKYGVNFNVLGHENDDVKVTVIILLLLLIETKHCILRFYLITKNLLDTAAIVVLQVMNIT